LTNRELLEAAARNLLDPQGRALLQHVEWWNLADGDRTPDLATEPYPLIRIGTGPPVLLLHGFDSCGLEFRRLAPLLASDHTLLIPDLHGFGFSPRPQPEQGRYGPEAVLQHLEALLDHLPQDQPLGLIGASMGGAVAMELARRQPKRIARLLLLAPAGLDGRPTPVPPGLDRLGVWFLSRPGVRRGLCRQAFADPERSVGDAELQIASLQLQVPGWGPSLAAFARSGGFAGCGSPLPSQPLHVLWGKNDRILRPPQRRAAMALLGERLEEVTDCGHLPHLDQPQLVARRWRQPEMPS